MSAHLVRAQQQAVTLSAEADPGLPEVEVDPDRMAQVLGNLLDNALRHTPAGGRVDCRASAADGAVTFTITDTGPGITPQDLPNIFERFYRSDASRQRDGGGSGLGLAIARSLVEAHGGRLWAESPPGTGARLCVTLPALPAP